MVTVAIHPFVVVRSFLTVERLAPFITAPTSNPTNPTSDTNLLFSVCILKQLLQPYHWLPVKHQPSNENPPAVRIAHP